MNVFNKIVILVVLVLIGACLVYALDKTCQGTKILLEDLEQRLTKALTLSNVDNDKLLLADDMERVKKLVASIYDNMLLEKMSRQDLYRNADRARALLEKRDKIREILNENVALHEEVITLKAEKEALTKNQEISEKLENLMILIRQLDCRLADVENCPEIESVKPVLTWLLSELADLKHFIH